jgi:hypothetical protein
MKLFARRRFLLRRLGGGLCVTLLAAILLSSVVALEWRGARGYVSVECGTLFFSTRPRSPADGLGVAWARGDWRWWFNAFPATSPPVPRPLATSVPGTRPEHTNLLSSTGPMAGQTATSPGSAGPSIGLPGVGRPGALYWRGWLPLWLPLVLVALPTLVLWWLERRPYPAGRCQQCGYDLTVNESGRCPECGRAAPTA